MENENPRLSALRDFQFHLMRVTIGRELDPADAMEIGQTIAERIALVVASQALPVEEASNAA